jgi:hypothetical protein
MTERRHALLLWLALAGLEVSWLCAWAAFVCSALSLPLCSPAQAFAVYALAATVGVQQAGSRLWRGSMHVVGLGGASLSCLSAALRTPAEALWPLAWLGRALDRPLLGLVACGFAIVLWQSGARSARSERSYRAVCARFDRGMFALLALLLFQLLMRKQLPEPTPLPGLLGVPLLVCGVCALALARNRPLGDKRFMGGFRGVGPLLSVLAGCLVIAAVSGAVLWPALHDASHRGYGGLYQLVRPAARAYADGVLYVMGMGRDRAPGHVARRLDATPKGRPSIGAPDALHEPVLEPALGTWMLLALALGALLLLWLARRWLSARSSQRQGWSLAWLWDWLRGLWARALRPHGRASEPLRLYLGLLRWGRQSGAAKRRSETPQEYAARLSRLSGLHADIAAILAAFQAHAYAAESNDASIRAARRALARLRAPRHWALRVKLWWVRDAYDELETLP